LCERGDGLLTGRSGEFMINALIRFSVSQRLLVLLMVGIMIGAGAYSLLNLPIDAVPDVTNVQVQVLTAAPSLAPLEIERQITFPVEVAMSGLPDIEEIRSVSKFGLSAVTVVFDDAVDTYFARQLVLERLSQAREQIPSNIGSPEMGPISTGLGEIYQYELRPAPGEEGKKFDATALRTIQDWSVRRQLLGVPGVTEVNSFGGQEKQYQVRLDPAKLMSYELSLRDVLEAVGRNNANVGGAYIEHGAEQYLLRGIGLAESAGDIANIIVKAGKEGIPIFVRDLGEVVEGATVRQGAVTADGKGEIVAGIAMMLKGENSRAVVSRVKERVEQVKKTLPKGVELVPFYDRTELVDRTIKTVVTNLVEGAILVIVVLILLLGNWRGALLVATIIPLSMLFAAILMRIFNVSGNLMSLGALDFGLIVDGAVVMVENTVRRRAEAQHAGSGEKPERTILESCVEVGRPVVFAVAIIMIVYLPILSLVGIEGKMFKPMALTVVFALLGSLILSLTYLPAAMTFILRGHVSENESFFIRYAKKWYRPAFNWVLGWRRTAVLAAAALVLVSGVTFPFLGSEFIPRLDEGSLAVQVQQLPSVSLSQSVRTVTEVEKVLMTFPEVTKVISKTGRAEVATDPMSVDFSDLYIELKPPSKWTTTHSKTELVEKMSEALEKRVPNASFSFSQPIELRVAELISGVRSDIAIKLFGDDQQRLEALARQAAEILRGVPGIDDVNAGLTVAGPNIAFYPDAAKLAQYGISLPDFQLQLAACTGGVPLGPGAGQAGPNPALAAYTGGLQAGQVQEGERMVPIRMRFRDLAHNDVKAIKAQPIFLPNGILRPVSAFARVEVIPGEVDLKREDLQRDLIIEARLNGRDLGGAIADIKRVFAAELALPQGYSVVYGGAYAEQQASFRELLTILFMAALLVFAVLLFLFRDFAVSTSILLIALLGIGGSLVALWITVVPLNVGSYTGIIMIVGIIAENAIFTVSQFFTTLRERGDVDVALKYSISVRIRPKLMTAIGAILALIPLALGIGVGAQMQQPLAVAVIGGFIAGLPLLLFVFPTLLRWVFVRRAVRPALNNEPLNT